MACEEWNLDEVQRIILLNNFNIDAFDDDHVTALQMAAATGNIGIVEYLLDNGADIEKSNQVGMTPLHHASRNGHTNVVRILVQRGANYHKLTYLGASAMTLAAAGGHLELVKLLLDLRVNVNPLHTALCPTPIIAAAFRRHTHICALLTHRGAYLDAHIQRLWNLSALSTAITCGAISVICALIELGANIQYRSLGGYNAIELAKLIHRYDALQIIEKSINTSLKEEKPVKVDIRARIAVRDENAIRIALRSGIRYTNTFPDGCTPLMYAVLLADSQIVKVILEEGSANIDAIENVSGLTALMFASIIGDSETIECLLNAGADATIVSFEGFTAFDYALASGTVDTESLCLLERHMEHCFMASSSLSSKNDIHQQLSRVIHSGKSKFLNRLSNHVGLSVSLGVNNNERKELLSNNFQYILHSITNAIQMDFQLANDLLRSQQHQQHLSYFNNNININNNNNNNKCDNLHNSIRIARFIAEQRVTQGLAPLPIAFVNDDSLQYDKYGNSIDSSISNKSSSQYTNEQRQKEYFSLAQRNADLFYEYRYPKTLDSKKSILGGSNRNRLLLFDDDNRRKISSSTSASGSDAQSFFADKIMMIQNHNLFEHQQQQCSTNTLLGTTARVRLRYKDTMDMDNNTNTNNINNINDDNNNNNNGDDDERSSPSRLSLNQYTFALKDDNITLRKSRSTPMLDGLMCRSSSPISSLSSNCFHSTRHSARSAISTFEHAHKRSSHSRLNEDSLWIKLRDSGLGDYISLLKSEEIDKATFLALTNEDLIDLGITNTLHRHSLLKIAKNLRHS